MEVPDKTVLNWNRIGSSQLPHPGIEVLWLYEDGFIFMEAIQENWESDGYIGYFLAGRGNYWYHGSITAWAAPE